MKGNKFIKQLIKEEVTRFLKEREEPTRITFESNPLEYILIKYPTLKNTLIDLMSTAFKDYIIGIYIIAPKPTTFKIMLHNNQYFYLTYLGKSYQCEVAGRKYYLTSIGEKQRAILAIADLLKLGRPSFSEGPDTESSSEPETPEVETPPSQVDQEKTES
jgi:hypothetical protein